MALTLRPEPFSQELNRLFNTFFEPVETAQRWVPAMDLVEADDHFVLKVDLPGMSEGDVNIEVQDGTLTISGERRADYERKERGFYRVERAFGSFSRSLTLPEGINPEQIAAQFKNGVLEVHIPKPEERKPRRISIKATGDGSQPATVEGTATES